MKRILLFVSVVCSLGTYAQRSTVQSAALYLRNVEMEDAKKAIDEAIKNDETKNDPQTWYYYTAVYDTIYRNPAAFGNLDTNVIEKFAIGSKRCLETDTKKRYSDYCNVTIINSAIGTYNKALDYYSMNDYANAQKFFNYVMDAFPYDKAGFLPQNNITPNGITYAMAVLGVSTGHIPEAKQNFQKLIDANYNEPAVYYRIANVYLDEGDTAKALSYVSMGREKFPASKDLITEEIVIYTAQGKMDILLKKYNEVLELNPDNALFLYNRGTVYDKLAEDSRKLSEVYRDTSAILSKKSKTEKVPATKLKLENASKSYKTQSDSLTKVSKEFFAKAEADYKNTADVDPDYIDAYINLGALSNNKAVEISDKMDAITDPIQSTEYNKKYSALKVVQDSILHVSLGYFQKALEVAEGMKEKTEDDRKYKKSYISSILFSIQQVYMNLGDEKNAMEIIKRRKELEQN